MLENVSKDTTAKARPPEVDVQLQKSQVKKSPRWREKSHRIMGPRFSQSIRNAVGFFFFFRPSPNFTPDDLQLSSINGRAGCEDKTLLTLIRTQSSDFFSRPHDHRAAVWRAKLFSIRKPRICIIAPLLAAGFSKAISLSLHLLYTSINTYIILALSC